ncbi:MAG: tyrosine-type recombinase/integrase [Aliihoeflea sp.]
MSKNGKKRPDGRAIRVTKTYTVAELAAATNKTQGTIYDWVSQGLPTIDARKPLMFHGSDVKAWLDKRWGGRRNKLALGELPCMGCKKARQPLPQTVRFEARPNGSMNAKAPCPVCSSPMNKALKASDVAAFQNVLGSDVEEEKRFDESDTSPVIPEMTAKNGARAIPVGRSGKDRRFNAFNERLKHEFLQYNREARGFAPASVRTQELDLDRYGAFIENRNFGSLTKDEAIAFKKHLREGTLSVPVVKATLKTIKAFHFWLHKTKRLGQRGFMAIDYLTMDAKEARKAIGIEKFGKYPTFDEIDQAIMAMPAKDLKDRRNRAMLLVLATTAVRLNAIRTLRIKHLDLENGCLHQISSEVETKFSKSFVSIILPVMPHWLEWLAAYKEDLLQAGYCDEDPLFPKTSPVKQGGFSNREMTKEFLRDGQMIERIFGAAFTNVGLKKFTPHSVRDTHFELANGRNTPFEFARALSANLGHSSLKVSATSYGHQSLEQKRDILLRRCSETDASSGEDAMFAKLEEMLKKYKQKRS